MQAGADFLACAGGASEALVRERLWKVAIHELGHTLGLPHCPNNGCLMQDAHGTVKTDCGARFATPSAGTVVTQAIARGPTSGVWGGWP